MGLIKAALGAAGGTLADQWKEFFYCDAIDNDVLAVKGQKRTSKRSSNTKGSDNIITTGSGGDNVVASLGIGGTFGCAFLTFYCQNVIVDGITVEKFFPLICKCTACGAKCCFNKSHIVTPFFLTGQ